MTQRIGPDGRASAIAVLGCGIVTAAGRGGQRTLDALRRGEDEPAPPSTIESELASTYPAFEVDGSSLERPRERLPGGAGRRSLRLALAAASDALSDAAATGGARWRAVPRDRIGVIVGATVGGMNHGEQWIEERLRSDGGPPGPPRLRVAARAAIRHLPLWEIAGELASRFGFRGPSFAVSTACTSGAQALATAGDLIATGACDAVLAGGVDCLSRLTYHGFAALGVMSRRRCSPFDARRDGLNLGEGAAFVVLARAESAGTGLPRLAGWGSNTDAHHMTSPRPDGSGIASAMRAALALGGVAPESVDWVHAHGTATPTNDVVEAGALRDVFGGRRVPVSSTKHVFGHTLGAAGAIGAVVGVLAMREGFLPGNAPVSSKDPACDVEAVPPAGLARRPGRVLVNSLGFGGASCALLLAEATS